MRLLHLLECVLAMSGKGVAVTSIGVYAAEYMYWPSQVNVWLLHLLEYMYWPCQVNVWLLHLLESVYVLAMSGKRVAVTSSGVCTGPVMLKCGYYIYWSICTGHVR